MERVARCLPVLASSGHYDVGFEIQVLKARLLGRKELVKKWSAAGEPLTDELLWRWLRSKHSLEQAEAGLLDHASWRINVGQISEVAFSRRMDCKEPQFWHLKGKMLWPETNPAD